MEEFPKIFCIGANIESYECMKALVDAQCPIHTLITLPGGESEGVSDYVDMHEFCAEHGIKTISTRDVNNPETIALVAEGNPDYLFTLGWSQIFKKDFISYFSKFIIGTHPSKLPYGRGRAPLPWTILEGLDESAVSFFKIDTGVDTGQLIMQIPFAIPKDCYVGELYEIVSDVLSKGFVTLYKQVQANKPFDLEPQSTENISHRAKRTPSDGLIDFKENADTIEKLIRAVSRPYPGAYGYYKDQRVMFWKGFIDHENKYHGTIGQILKKNKEGILVQCGKGTIWLQQPTDENGESLSTKFFRLGDRIGYQVQDEIFYLRQKLK